MINNPVAVRLLSFAAFVREILHNPRGSAERLRLALAEALLGRAIEHHQPRPPCAGSRDVAAHRWVREARVGACERCFVSLVEVVGLPREDPAALDEDEPVLPPNAERFKDPGFRAAFNGLAPVVVRGTYEDLNQCRGQRADGVECILHRGHHALGDHVGIDREARRVTWPLSDEERAKVRTPRQVAEDALSEDASERDVSAGARCVAADRRAR